MVGNTEHFEMLAGTALFSGLPKRSLETIAALAREVDHQPGEVIVTEGSTAYGLHLIIEGTADVAIGGASVAELGPGDTFGEIALLDEGTRTATVTAKTPLRVIAIHGSGFRNALKAEPDLAYALVLHLAGLVRELDAQIADIRTGGAFR